MREVLPTDSCGARQIAQAGRLAEMCGVKLRIESQGAGPVYELGNGTV